ncbi:MAG TPA: hypothetical protein DD643_00440 [Synechococcus sp. UBA8638]|nr:hypothetical protein [Synechococcus sp. UBA8638]
MAEDALAASRGQLGNLNEQMSRVVKAIEGLRRDVFRVFEYEQEPAKIKQLQEEAFVRFSRSLPQSPGRPGDAGPGVTADGHPGVI